MGQMFRFTADLTRAQRESLERILAARSGDELEVASQSAMART